MLERLVTLLVLARCPLKLVASNGQMTQEACFGYITGPQSFLSNMDPVPIECGSEFGDSWGPEEHQDLSCCSGSGRYFVQTSQIGGFSVVFDTNSDFFYDYPYKCIAYSDALQALLCDPQQGKYISDNVLRVCRSSCNAVFDECGLPGEVFPRWADYEDGTSLCLDMFGFFGSSPCESWPDGFVCQSGLEIEVVDSDCLGIIEPSDSVLKHYANEQAGPSSCSQDNGIDDASVAGIIVGVLAAFVASCVCFFTYLSRRAQHKQSDASANASGGHVQDEETHFPTPAETKKYDSPAMVVATPIPTNQYSIGNPSATPPGIYPSAPAEEAVVETMATPVLPPVVTVESENTFAAHKQGGASSLIEMVEQAQTHEKSKVIRQWLCEHPSEAAALTPNDAAEVLSKVTFSLDQTTAAAELASGMKTSLTCAHVAAVLHQSKSMNTADIAKAMVPHVSDAQNKELVLREIQFVFERNEVSRRFPRTE